MGDGVAVTLAELEIVDVDEIVARADNVADAVADAEAEELGENDAIADGGTPVAFYEPHAFAESEVALERTVDAAEACVVGLDKKDNRGGEKPNNWDQSDQQNRDAHPDFPVKVAQVDFQTPHELGYIGSVAVLVDARIEVSFDPF